MCRVHALLIELAPGGIAKEIRAGDIEPFLAALTVTSPAEQMRHDMVLELLGDIRRLDSQLKESHERIGVAVKVSGTSLVDIYGIGPIIAAMVIGYTGDVTRFANRDHYAAYTGTAPIEFSSGGRDAHRVVAAREPAPQPRAPPRR